MQGADLRLIDPNTAQEIRLRAEQGELLAPSGGVQRGTLTGGVQVELRESPEAEPTLTLNTSEVSFDEILGEIRAESRMVAEGERGGFIGSKLVIRTAADGSPVRITLQSLEVLTLTEADEDSAADTTIRGGHHETIRNGPNPSAKCFDIAQLQQPGSTPPALRSGPHRQRSCHLARPAGSASRNRHHPLRRQHHHPE